MDLGLRGARVLVTAASQGLGAATARRFSLEGAIVVISSRDLKKLQNTASGIVAESGNPVFTMAADVTNPAEVEQLVTNTVEALGGLDILVTNAGGPSAGGFGDLSAEEWQSAFDLAFASAANLIRAALPHLRQSPRAAILTVTSSSARQPVDNLILSSTIRPAILGLTKSLSRELGPEGIRVNSILPGTTDTDRITQLMEANARKNGTSADAEREKVIQEIPLRRMGKPDEFANVAVFLCSPAAAFVTGVALQVDGGSIRATF